MHPHWRGALVLAALFASTGAAPARGEEGCLDFKWEVSKERALFASTPTSLAAGTEVKSAPALAVDRAYSLKLAPQRQVAFAAGPGKSPGDRPAYAGLATLKVPSTATYRISIDMPFWIDVVARGTLLSPTDFQGQHTCAAPHKIVEFTLQAGSPLVLQLSGGNQDGVVLTVTAAPPRKL